MSQVPTPQAAPNEESNVTSVQDVCDAYGPFPQQGSGGSAGGIMGDIPDGAFIPVSGDEGSIWVGGKKIGQVDQLVVLQGHKFIYEMAVYLKPMVDAAAAEGVTLKINSGFRTYAKQQALYQRDPPWGGPGGYTARPGSSPHQCGLAVDFKTNGERYTPAWEWLVKNAYRYGFIRRVRNERWHFEYLGTWPGQEIPDYAVQWAETRPQKQGIWGSGMFAHVHRDGSNAVAMKEGNRWGDRNHPDWTTSKPNTWTNWYGELLPDKFDREDPGWAQRGPAPVPPPPPPETAEADPEASESPEESESTPT
jgi:hypothetical protein